MIFALVGNQNCGKTTIFNQITNMNQHIGNFPGVTIDIKFGKIPQEKNYEIVDLPGLYSLNTFTKEEIVSEKFIVEQKPDAIINVVDATNLERNLYLTLQLKELGIPIIIALNMLDELEENKGKIKIKELEKRLNIPIIPLTTVTKKEVDEVVDKAIEIANKSTKKVNVTNKKKCNDDDIKEKYHEIENICKDIIYIEKNNSNQKKTYYIDKILTNKFLGIPIFILIMYTIFYLTFNVLGDYCTTLINKGIEVVTDITRNTLINNNVNQIIQTLILEGVFNGVGSVVSFLPIIIILYFFLSILEDSGYMTRIAFILDKPLSKIGLSGRSAVAILLGFGCSVPAILSTRTIQSDKERKLTMQLVPFMSCSAKIPIYAIFVSTFFKRYESIAMIIIYSIGAIIGITITAITNNKEIDASNFIMELPNYRMPSIKNTCILMWNKAKEFIQKAFSIIFVSSLLIWFLKSFDMNLYLTSTENSILAQIGKKISPIFGPLGLSDWRVVTSIIAGISAKETIISTLSILTNTTIKKLPYTLQNIFSLPSSISFLIFVLLYTPCIATIGVIKKEFNLKTAIKVAINQFIIAYIISFLAFNLSNLFLNFF